MSIAFYFAIAFGSFLVGLFVACIIKTSGAESMMEEIRELREICERGEGKNGG